MKTVSISYLKAHLSAKLKEVQKGSRIVILDHKRPVALLSSLEEEPLFTREAERKYLYRKLEPITPIDPLEKLQEEREDRC